MLSEIKEILKYAQINKEDHIAVWFSSIERAERFKTILMLHYKVDNTLTQEYTYDIELVDKRYPRFTIIRHRPDYTQARGRRYPIIFVDGDITVAEYECIVKPCCKGTQVMFI